MKPRPHGVLVEMAVSARVGFEPLYRSVSPWELEDIIDRGHVIGKGAFFSGDAARTAKRVWYGRELKDVARHGTDWRRFLESTPEFRRAFELKSQIETDRDAASPPHDASMRDRMRWPDAKRRVASKLGDLFSDFQDKLFRQLGKLLARVTKLQEKQPAGFVIEVHGVSGGTVYSGPDSLAGSPGSHGARDSPDEVAMPSTVKVSDIVRVHAVDKKGTVIDVWERPASGWTRELFGRKGVNAPDVRAGLKQMDSMTASARKKYDGIIRR